MCDLPPLDQTLPNGDPLFETARQDATCIENVLENKDACAGVTNLVTGWDCHNVPDPSFTLSGTATALVAAVTLEDWIDAWEASGGIEITVTIEVTAGDGAKFPLGTRLGYGTNTVDNPDYIGFVVVSVHGDQLEVVVGDHMVDPQQPQALPSGTALLVEYAQACSYTRARCIPGMQLDTSGEECGIDLVDAAVDKTVFSPTKGVFQCFPYVLDQYPFQAVRIHDTTLTTAENFFIDTDANGDSLITFPELMAVDPGPSELFACMFDLIVTDNTDTNGRWSVAECRGVSRSEP